MIEYISGILSEASEDYIVVEAGGLGYRLNISKYFFMDLPPLLSSLKVYAYLLHRENVMELYGFSSVYERSIFRELLNVSGIGPKLSMKVLSSCSADEIVSYITSRNVKSLSGRVSGLGKKTTDKVMMELSDKFSKLYSVPTKDSSRCSDDYASLAFDTLCSLGYGEVEADRVLKLLMASGDLKSTEDLVQEGLKLLSRG